MSATEAARATVPDAEDPLQARSPALLRLFALYLRLRMRGSFHALRISGATALPSDRPLIVYSNHPSWWDPMVYILLGTILFPGRPGFGPMEASALQRYSLLRRFGVFGLPAGAAGARRFLEVGRRVLGPEGRGPSGAGMIWMTAQGRFADARQRPIALRPGVAHLLRAVPGALAVPLALDYVFWNESKPEVLARFGTPIAASGDTGMCHAALEAALTETADRLAVDAAARDPAAFDALLSGAVGSGLVYDGWRRLRAGLSGERFHAAHEPR